VFSSVRRCRWRLSIWTFKTSLSLMSAPQLGAINVADKGPIRHRKGLIQRKVLRDQYNGVHCSQFGSNAGGDENNKTRKRKTRWRWLVELFLMSSAASTPTSHHKLTRGCVLSKVPSGAIRRTWRSCFRRQASCRKTASSLI